MTSTNPGYDHISNATQTDHVIIIDFGNGDKLTLPLNAVLSEIAPIVNDKIVVTNNGDSILLELPDISLTWESIRYIADKDNFLKMKVKAAAEEARLVGAKIKKARIKKGYTPDKLGELIDVSRATILKIERGEVGVDSLKIYMIAAAMEMSPEELLAVQVVETAQEDQ